MRVYVCACVRARARVCDLVLLTHPCRCLDLLQTGAIHHLTPPPTGSHSLNHHYTRSSSLPVSSVRTAVVEVDDAVDSDNVASLWDADLPDGVWLHE